MYAYVGDYINMELINMESPFLSKVSSRMRCRFALDKRWKRKRKWRHGRRNSLRSIMARSKVLCHIFKINPIVFIKVLIKPFFTCVIK